MNNKNQLHNLHDKFFKNIYSNLEVTTAFLQKMLPDEVATIIDFKTLKRESGTFVNKKLKEFLSDLIFSCKLCSPKSGEQIPADLYILLEHKSAPYTYVSLQILNYMVQTWLQNEKKLPIIIPLVVYHGKTKWEYKPLNKLFNIPLEFDFLQRYIPNVDIQILDVAKADSEDLIKNKGTMILTFLKAMQSQNAAKEIVHFAFSGYIDLSDKLIKELIEQLLIYIDLNDNRLTIEIKEELAKMDNLDVRIQESKQFLHALYAPDAEAFGIQIGETRGIQIGKFAGIREILLNQLSIKFADYPISLESKINSINSLERLTQLSADLLRAETIVDFEKTLDNRC